MSLNSDDEINLRIGRRLAYLIKLVAEHDIHSLLCWIIALRNLLLLSDYQME